MSPDYQVQVIFLKESLGYVRPKYVRDASRRLAPVLDIGIGVRPQQVAKDALIRHFSGSHDLLYLLKSFAVGTQSTMHAQNAILDTSGNREPVEGPGEPLPEL